MTRKIQDLSYECQYSAVNKSHMKNIKNSAVKTTNMTVKSHSSIFILSIYIVFFNMLWILRNGAQHCFFISILSLKANLSLKALSKISFQIIRKKLI